MKNEIISKLREMEQKRDCRVLFAAEAGSRAWGFPSPDSDYDIRFFYVHRVEWYLRLATPRDTLQWFSGDLDFSGWDLRKALQLFVTCNPSMNEQLDSPVVYEANDEFLIRIQNLIPVYFRPIRAVFHYLGIAAKYSAPVLQGEQMSVKKLLYVVRPLLAGEWIVQFRTMPPTVFRRLLDGTEIDLSLRKIIEEILVQKETALEHDKITVTPLLVDWIRDTTERLPNDAKNFPKCEKAGWEPLQELFEDIIFEKNSQKM